MKNSELAAFNRKRKIVQVCYVTDDCKKTIEYLYHILDLGPWKIFSFSNENTSDIRLNGSPVTEPFQFRVAICLLGDVQIEVIQPVYGPTIYDEFLKTHGRGIHHIKEKTPKPEVEAMLKKAERFGCKEAFFGYGFQGEEDIDCFAYIDTYNALGAYYEFGNCPTIKPDQTQFSVWPEEEH